MDSAESALRFEIENQRPIELSDLTGSLYGLADEYRRFIAEQGLDVPADLRLYVKEIKSGSVVAELLSLAPATLPLLAEVNTVAAFVRHLKSVFDFLLTPGKSESIPDKTTLQNAVKIVEPVAKDYSSQLNIGYVQGSVYIQIDSRSANAAQNAAKRFISEKAEPDSGLHEKVLMRWHQARADVSTATGDRAVIESISNRPTKVTYSNDATKAVMIYDEKNPFKTGYVVDVVVDTVNGKPALYKIVAMHDKVDLEGLA